MWGTTPPCEMITVPSSLLSLSGKVSPPSPVGENRKHALFVVLDGQLQMTRHDTGLLVVAGSVASKFEDLGSKIFKDCSEVDGCTGTNTLCVVALLKQTVDTSDRELDCE